MNKKSGSMVNAVLRNMQRKQNSDPSWLKTIKRNNIELSFQLVSEKMEKTIWRNKYKSCATYIKISNVLRVDTNQLSRAIRLLNQSSIEVERYEIFNSF